jgi:stage III sporulation protein AB
MIIKYIGLFLSFLFFTFIGLYKSRSVSVRKENIREILLFLNQISTNIRYKNDDVFSLVGECAAGVLEPLKAVNGEHKDYLKIINTLPLNKEDLTLLKEFFAKLGTTDVDGQLSHIDLYKEIFQEQYNKSKSDIEKKCKLYRMAGIFAGLAFVVMFI